MAVDTITAVAGVAAVIITIVTTIDPIEEASCSLDGGTLDTTGAEGPTLVSESVGPSSSLLF